MSDDQTWRPAPLDYDGEAVTSSDVECQRKSRIAKLREAAKAACLSKVVKWPRAGGLARWVHDDLKIGLELIQVKDKWAWGKLSKRSQMNPGRYDTPEDAIRAGLLYLAEKEEARLQ